MNDYKVTLRRIIRPFDIVFFLVFDLLLFSQLRVTEGMNKLVIAVFFAVFLYATYESVIKTFIFKLILLIEDDHLTTIDSVFGFHLKSEKFYIYDLKAITIEENVKEMDNYWYSGRWPFQLRYYYKTPAVLTFLYKNQKFYIGMKYLWENIEEFKDELNKRKNTPKSSYSTN